MLTSSPASPGTTACWPSRDRRSLRLLSATPSTQATAILRSAAWAAIPTRPSRSMWSGGRRQLQFMSWSGTCVARTARGCAAIRTSGATWSRCGRRRPRRAIRRRRGGRGRDDASHGTCTTSAPGRRADMRPTGRRCLQMTNPDMGDVAAANRSPWEKVCSAPKGRGSCGLNVTVRTNSTRNAFPRLIWLFGLSRLLADFKGFHREKNSWGSGARHSFARKHRLVRQRGICRIER